MKQTGPYIFAISVLFGAAAAADPIEAYFRADSYECGSRSYESEWQIAGDTQTGATVSTFQRRTGRTSLTGSQWQLSAEALTGDVVVNGSNGRPAYRFIGIGTQAPQVIPLDRKGEPIKDCSPVLTAVPTPVERYGFVLSHLSIDAPTPADAAAVPDLLSALPPTAFLPTLEQAATSAALKEKQRAFDKRFLETSKQRAGTVEDDQILDQLTHEWLTGSSKGQRARRNLELLLAAQNIRATALFSAGADVTDLRITEGDEFCSRVERTAQGLDWRQALEGSTGLPLMHWTPELAQSFLDQAAPCPSGAKFSSILSKRWPEAQKRAEDLKELVAERDRLAALDISLSSVAQNNWLELQPDLKNKARALGLGQLLEPVLEQKRQEAIAALPSDLAAEAEAADLSLEALLSYCRQKRADVTARMRRSALVDTVFSGCEDRLAAMLEERAIVKIHAARDAFLARKGTRADLLETNGYDLSKVLPNLYSRNAAFTPVLANIEAELITAQNQTNDAFNTAMDAATKEVKAAFAKVEPMTESEENAAALCREFTGFGAGPRLQPLSNLCRTSMQMMARQRAEYQCDLVWDDIDAPDGLQQGYVNQLNLLTGVKPVPVRDLMCNAAQHNQGLSIVRKKGLFSSQYRLTRNDVIGGTPVQFSVKLNEPESGNNWTASDPEMEPGPFDTARFKTSDDLIGCIFFLEVCFRGK
ncbi:hypothetical protein [Actibacterium lipolyticum]|uniref:Lysozyme inhibitor LprI N-terminal domain-containing protein n=1 Tax=Actibacterium lipolyticum TaxID=1524263 RepID=A0A238KT68_9RHOB|nr:hypothetical protein [Actibacterium lipolyticum]SMX46024.1 hypothetical protein COL8621_02950 [Actibacterium lipolyticum]